MATYEYMGVSVEIVDPKDMAFQIAKLTLENTELKNKLSLSSGYGSDAGKTDRDLEALIPIASSEPVESAPSKLSKLSKTAPQTSK